MTATFLVREPIAESLPFEERVRQRAYAIYLHRGNRSGSELEDWLQAEREILMAVEQEGDEE